MPILVSQLYSSVVKIFMEDTGFSAGTGIFTDDQFFKELSDVLLDMMDKVSCIKKIVKIPMIAGVSSYDEPNMCSTVQAVHVSQTFVFRDSGLYLNASNPYWDTESGQPAKWREDRIPQTLQLIPNPDVDGYETLAALPGGYGVISGTTAAVDYDIIADSGVSGYGTISGAPNGPIYLESQNQGFGTIGDMVSSTGNVQLISAAIPFEVQFSMQDWLELIPDPFVPYLKYGICARLFSTDSEAKNVAQGNYCKMRYEEGLTLVESIMNEENEVNVRSPSQPQQ